MNCDKYMEHLNKFLDSELNELEAEAMQAHRNTCPACAAETEKQRALLEELAHLDEGVKAPEGLLKNTMERIHRERRPGKTRGWWIGGGIAAALCVTVGASMLFAGGLGARSNEAAAAYDKMEMYSAPQAAGAYSVSYDGAGNAIYTETAAEEDFCYDEPAADAPMPEAPMADMAAANMAYPAAAAGEFEYQTASADRAVEAAAEEYGLKIIREATIELQTENYAEDMEKLKALVAEFGGFITSSEENGSEAYADRYSHVNRWCSLTIRVPSGQLDAFIERFEQVGIVSFTAVNETDVTAQYTDTDRRLQSYKKQYDRVLTMMDMAETVEDLISIESELARLEMQIEDAQGSLNHWDSRVNMSTVHVYVNEVKRATPITEDPTLGQRMAESLSDNWYYFVEGAKNALVNVYGSIPYIAMWILVLGAGAGIVLLIVRKIRRKTGRKSKK